MTAHWSDLAALYVLQAAPQVLGAVIPATVRTAQIMCNEDIAGASCHVVNWITAFNVFNIMTEGAHATAEKSAMKLVTEFSQQGLDGL